MDCPAGPTIRSRNQNAKMSGDGLRNLHDMHFKTEVKDRMGRTSFVPVRQLPSRISAEFIAS